MGHIEARDTTLTYDTPSGAVPGVHGVSFGMVAVADGIGSDLMDFSPVDPMPVFMAATPDFVQDKPDTVIAHLKAWLDVAKDFKNDPQKVTEQPVARHLRQGAIARRGESWLPRRSAALHAGAGADPVAG